MTTWEEIRDEVAGTLADGQPLEDVIAKLEKRKNEMAKQMTNEEWLRQCNTEELVKMILDLCDDRPCFACGIGYCDDENWCHVYSDEAKEFVTDWLKQPHQ